MSNLDYNILKELDRHTIDGKIIGIIMNNLKYVNDKNKFLNYLINNRNIKLNKFEIIEFIKDEIINNVQ